MRRHASNRFQNPLIPNRLKKILCSFLLLWLCGATPVKAQRQEKYFWWGMHLKTLRDSINAQGYWRKASLGDDNVPDTKFEGYYSLDQRTLIVFRLELDFLDKTIVRTETSTAFSRLFEQWISESQRVSEDTWYHSRSMTVITKERDTKGSSTYTRAPDLEQEMAKKLNALK